ncbi:MAG TPA: 30S ribosomal protein S16 [Vicinamibacterales bacterium]|nr:30S ribosomal protein S16 [Vicinamibacterales bacterium]
MLAIRLSRTGSKKQPHYRVVVCEARQPTQSRFVEILGHYNPRSEAATLEVDRERVEHWLKAGARPSQTVRSLLARPVPSTPAPEATPETGATAQ